MTPATLPSFHPSPRPPALRMPPGACDAHCHVFGPAARLPFTADRLVDLLAAIAPSDVARQAVLVDNPARLYRFPVALESQPPVRPTQVNSQ